jgi:hypothetical protein
VDKKPENLSFKKTLDDILEALAAIKKILQERWQEITDDSKMRAIATSIRKNTYQLSKLSTNPTKENEMTTPGEDVTAALAEQTDAIATLSAELADEHDEWVKAVEAGDSGQAEKIVSEVKSNTDKLRSLSDELASSHPGSNPEPTPTPHQ